MRAILAEDQALLRVGITRILEASAITVVDAVDNGPLLERALTRDDFDVAIVDVRLPPTFSTEGLSAAIAAREARPGLPVLVLSQHVEPVSARELLASGAGSVGYLLKDRVADVDEFVAAVRRVAGGGTALDPEVVAGLVSGSASRRPLARLTERERDVLGLMAEGRSNAAIAGRLFVSEKAISKHTHAIFMKLDLPQAADDNRRVLAVLAWLQQG
ncbi:LuxR C-terminal-related transcriptional regulator [Couchioplanes caeruleus]|uniref:DNA-binding response regulator n=1 Tax=Couchioplanes caeruleus subsp. caeruleus TaxID=56427 RepID=A0A1K0GCB2_9ACTN|nr:response regulator transcription factor [Couchioplanes caeruleus]OJF14882.1 DNA-binding response regulator [Couchioplanes caeruleus subsp. caeruleus]